MLILSKLLLLITSFIVLTQCSLYEAFPINKQFPPVARIDESFQFLLSNDTYKSTTGYSQISYKAYSLPSWLSFDSTTRILSGTPPSSVLGSGIDLLYFDFTLEGTDESDNASLNKTYQLVVSDSPRIEISDDFNLLALLKNFGQTNGRQGLILSPNEVFNVTFERSAFTNEDSIVGFYGRSELYNAPLPSWLFFDPKTLKFSGKAPVVNSDIAPQVTYEFVLVATDINGFSSVELPFSLVVGAHELTTSVQNTLLINVTDTGEFSYAIPLNYMFLDGEEVQSANITTSTLENAPYWVEFDNYTISGTVPNVHKFTTSNEFTLAMHDVYGDVIYLNFEVVSTSNLFAVTNLSNINATRGEWFQYNFLPSQFTNYADTNITLEYTNKSQSYDWLSFHATNLTLSGQVPNDFSILSLDLVAVQDSIMEKLNFDIIGTDSLNTHNSTTNITSSTRTSSTSSSSSILHSATSSSTKSFSSSSATLEVSSTPISGTHSKSNKKAVAIACGVAIPVGLIVLLLILFLFWRKNRKERKDTESTPETPGTTGPSVDPYVPGLDSDEIVDPFSDKFMSHSSTPRNLGALNVMKLDDSSSQSETSTLNEKLSKLSDSDIFYDASHTQSTEMLLQPDNHYTDDFNQNRTSSLYLNNEPANRKSWRYNPERPSYNGKEIRESIMSINTVSTDELLTTEITSNNNISKDPRKSTLGLRDSVFGSGSTEVKKNSMLRYSSKTNLMPVLDEHENDQQYQYEGTISSSSSDEFVPVQAGNTYNWVQKTELNRKLSQKRFVDLNDKGNFNVEKGLETEGHVPEQI